MGRYRYIYLPPPKRPPFGARVDHMIQIQHGFQLNKIRILFNSLPPYTHIYTYIHAYHCISCIHSTAYRLHLPCCRACYAMHRRVHRAAHALHHTSRAPTAPRHRRIMPDIMRIQGDPLRAIYGIKSTIYSQTAQANRLHNG